MKKNAIFLFNILAFSLFSILPSFEIEALKDSTEISKSLLFLFIIFNLVVIITCIHFYTNFHIRLYRFDVILLIITSYITINRYLLHTVPFSINYYEFICLLALFFILRSIPRKTHLYIFLAIIIGGIIQAAQGQFQLLGYLHSKHAIFNLTGSFSNPGPYAGYLASVFVLSLGIYSTRKLNNIDISSENNSTKQTRKKINQLVNSIIKLVPTMGMLSILIILPVTQSRSAWIAAISGTTYILCQYVNVHSLIKNHVRNTIKRRFIYFISLCVVIISLYELYDYKTASADSRLLIWRITISMIKDHPLIGLGFDNFKSSYMAYQSKYFSKQRPVEEVKIAGDVDYAFNDLIQFTSENGLIGTIGLFFLVLSLFKASKNSNYEHLLPARASLLSLFIFALFSYPIQILSIKLTLVSYLAVITYSLGRSQPVYSKMIDITKVPSKTKMVLIFSLFCLSIYTNRKLNQLKNAYNAWEQAYSYYLNQNYDLSISFFAKAYPYLYNNGPFLMQYSKALSMGNNHIKTLILVNQGLKYYCNSVMYIAAGDSYKNLKRYSEAERAYITASNMLPGGFYPKYLLLKLYIEMGLEDQIRKTAKDLTSMEIKIHSIATQQILFEAEEVLEKRTIQNIRKK